MKKFLLFLLLLTFIGCSSSNRKIYTEDEVIAAAVVDNVYILNRAIKSGFNIEQELRGGDTLLSLALKEDSLRVISVLLANSSNLNKDLPAIFYANSLEALQLFFNERADLNAFTSDGEFLLNFYIKTKPEEFGLFLIDNGVQLKVFDSSGWAPIFWAVNIENETILKRMLSKDSSLYLLKDKKRNYPIYYANSEEMIRVLLDGRYNPNDKNIYGENILGEVYLKVKRLGYKNLIPLLLEKGVDSNYRSYR